MYYVITVLRGLLLLVVLGVAYSLMVPVDSPRARMFRTEADLTSLVTALETYKADKGEYPPSGPAGLRMATDHLSRTANYMPDGPPPDGWGRPYCYVRAQDYAGSDTVLRDSGGNCHAPGTYQLYSAGEDGNLQTQQDNICSWRRDAKPWREWYEK